jgi:hypothetical protein
MMARTLKPIWMATLAIAIVAPGLVFGQQATLLRNQIGSARLLQVRPAASISARCTVQKLVLTVNTGGDDLRGGSNNLNVEIHQANGQILTAKNVNAGKSWPNNSEYRVTISLNTPLPIQAIKSFRLVHLAQGSVNLPAAMILASVAVPVAGVALSTAATINGAAGVQTEDNWDMTAIQIVGLGPQGDVPLAKYGAYRFTGSAPSLDIAASSNITCAQSGQIQKLVLTFRTSNDDLRGGSDNLDVTIRAAGLEQTAPNVNGGQDWANGSTHQVSILLNKPVTAQQLQKIILTTTSQGGLGGDNWNMDSVKIDALDSNATIRTQTEGFHRFTGPPGNILTIPWNAK